MKVVLIRVKRDGSQQPLKIKHATTIFGRGDDCTVRIPLPRASRHHCELSVTNEGSIAVRDLGSSNGTFVNQDKTDKAALSAGDLLSFGGLVFVVQVNGDPAEIDAAMMYEDGVPEDDDVPHAPSAVEQRHTQQPPSEPLVPAGDLDGSSAADFDFDFTDDDEDQPPL